MISSHACRRESEHCVKRCQYDAFLTRLLFTVRCIEYGHFLVMCCSVLFCSWYSMWQSADLRPPISNMFGQFCMAAEMKHPMNAFVRAGYRKLGTWLCFGTLDFMQFVQSDPKPGRAPSWSCREEALCPMTSTPRVPLQLKRYPYPGYLDPTRRFINVPFSQLFSVIDFYPPLCQLVALLAVIPPPRVYT